jgi:hypothetical protein
VKGIPSASNAREANFPSWDGANANGAESATLVPTVNTPMKAPAMEMVWWAMTELANAAKAGPRSPIALHATECHMAITAAHALNYWGQCVPATASVTGLAH